MLRFAALWSGSSGPWEQFPPALYALLSIPFYFWKMPSAFASLKKLHETVCCRIVSNDSQVVPVIGSGNAKLVVVIVSEAPSWNPISDDPMDLFLWVLTLRCTAKMTAYLRARLETYSDLLHVQPMA